MKILLRTVLILIFLIGNAGCGSFGKDFDQNMVKDIRNKHTTKTEILDWFGVPFKEGTEDGLEMWTYQYDSYSLGKTDSKDLVILFDKNGRVKAYRYTSSIDDK